MIDERTLLRTFHDDRARPDDLALARARAQLMARTHPSSRRAGWSWGRGPRLAAAAVATAGLVGGLVVTQTFGPSGASASAAEVLDRAAAAAGRGVPAQLPGPGQFLYDHSIYADIQYREDGTVNADKVCFGAFESWTPAGSIESALTHSVDGVTAASARTPGAPVADPGCEFSEFTEDAATDSGEVPEELSSEVTPADGPPFVPPGGEAGGTWWEPDATFTAALPTDPKSLYERARADAVGFFGNESVDDSVLDLLASAASSSSPQFTPELRAAAFRAIAFVPGVELTGTGTTLWGDQGQVVSRVDPALGSRDEIVFAEGGDLLGWRSTSVDATLTGVPVGTVFSDQAWRSSVVGALGERPTG